RCSTSPQRTRTTRRRRRKCSGRSRAGTRCTRRRRGLPSTAATCERARRRHKKSKKSESTLRSALRNAARREHETLAVRQLCLYVVHGLPALRHLDEEHVVPGERARQPPHCRVRKDVGPCIETAGLLRNELQAGFERVVVGIGDVEREH